MNNFGFDFQAGSYGDGSRATSTTTGDLEAPNAQQPEPSNRRPRNRREFIANLDPSQITEIAGPIQRGVIATDSVFNIQDPQTHTALPFSGREILDIAADPQTEISEDAYELSIVPDPNLNPQGSPVTSTRNGSSWVKKHWLTVVCLLETAALVALLIVVAWPSPNQNPIHTTPIPTTTVSSVPEVTEKILIFGGVEKQNTTLIQAGSIEEYWPERPELNRVLNVTMPLKTQFSVVGQIGNLLYIAGGYLSGNRTLIPVPNLQIYNLSTEEFSVGPNMEIARTEAAGVVRENKLFVCGGVAIRIPPKLLKSCEFYDPKSNEWGHISDMQTSRINFGIESYGNYLFTIGGANFELGMIPWSEKYDFTTKVWTKMAGLSVPAYALATANFEGTLWACGGKPAFREKNLYRCETFDWKAEKWTESTNMTARREAFQVIAFNDKLFALGGAIRKVPDNSVEVYEPRSLAWKTAQTFIKTRWGAAMVAV